MLTNKKLQEMGEILSVHREFSHHLLIITSPQDTTETKEEHFRVQKNSLSILKSFFYQNWFDIG